MPIHRAARDLELVELEASGSPATTVLLFRLAAVTEPACKWSAASPSDPALASARHGLMVESGDEPAQRCARSVGRARIRGTGPCVTPLLGDLRRWQRPRPASVQGDP